MGAPGWTSFCEKGHIVEICQHHQIIDDPKKICDACGADVLATITEWGDSDYGPFPVPDKPIRQQRIMEKVTCPYCKKVFRTTKCLVDVYDISRFLRRKKHG